MRTAILRASGATAGRRNALLGALLACVLGPLGAGRALAGDDPSAAAEGTYAGRPASWWVRELADPRTNAVALQALILIGSPALPALLNTVVTADAPSRSAILVAIPAIPGDPSGFEEPVRRAIQSEHPEAVATALQLISRSDRWSVPLLAALAARVDDPVPGIRDGVVRAFAAMGPNAAPVSVPLLLTLFEGPDPGQRRVALGAFARLGPAASGAGPAIARALSRAPSAEAVSLVNTLGLLGPKAPGVLPALREVLARDDAVLRGEAADALASAASLGAEALPDFLALLQDPDWNIRHRVLTKTMSMPELTRAALPAFVAAFSSSDASFRGLLIPALTSYGRALEPSLPSVIEALCATQDTRSLSTLFSLLEVWAAPALARAYPTAPSGLRPVIVDCLNRWPSQSLLPFATLIVPELALDLAAAADSSPCLGAAMLLGKLAPDSPSALEVLVSSLATTEQPCSGAIAALIHNGAAARSPLFQLLSRDDPGVRRRVLGVLLKIRLSPVEWEVIARRITDEDPEVRRLVAFALMGAGALRDFESPLERGSVRVDLDALVRVLSDLARRSSEGPTRWDAMRCLGQLGAPSKSALPVLLEALSDEDRRVVNAAADAVGKIARAVEVPVEDVLHAAADSTDPYVRSGAALVLARLGGRSRDALRLLPPLKAQDPIRLQVAILEVAAALGPDAGVYLAPAMSLRASKDQALANAAVRASDAIKAPPPK